MGVNHFNGYKETNEQVTGQVFWPTVAYKYPLQYIHTSVHSIGHLAL